MEYKILIYFQLQMLQSIFLLFIPSKSISKKAKREKNMPYSRKQANFYNVSDTNYEVHILNIVTLPRHQAYREMMLVASDLDNMSFPESLWEPLIKESLVSGEDKQRIFLQRHLPLWNGRGRKLQRNILPTTSFYSLPLGL